MKKYIALFICTVLCLFSGCASNEVQVDTGNDVQTESTAEVPQTPTQAPASEGAQDIQDVPVDATLAPDVSSYSYSTLTEGSFTMQYPSHWERVPGTNTICFIEPADDGTIPGRIALTRKTASKTVDDKAKLEQFSSYFESIMSEFDSYEVGELSKNQEFLGDTTAYSATYTAQSGDKLYMGYAIIAAKGKTICVYHFRCAQTDYARMTPVMEYVKNSIGASKQES